MTQESELSTHLPFNNLNIMYIYDMGEVLVRMLHCGDW